MYSSLFASLHHFLCYETIDVYNVDYVFPLSAKQVITVLLVWSPIEMICLAPPSLCCHYSTDKLRRNLDCVHILMCVYEFVSV